MPASRRAPSKLSPPFLPPPNTTQVLDRSEADLAELCSDLASDEERRRCWDVYRFFAERRAAAQSGCVREMSEGDGRPGQHCEVCVIGDW